MLSMPTPACPELICALAPFSLPPATLPRSRLPLPPLLWEESENGGLGAGVGKFFGGGRFSFCGGRIGPLNAPRFGEFTGRAFDGRKDVSDSLLGGDTPASPNGAC